MTIWDWFSNKSSAEPAAFCATEFPQLWSSFVTSVADNAFTGEATAVPPPPQGNALRKAAIPLVLPAAERLVAIGDLHGDYNKTVRAFRLAGLVDQHNRWAGGTTTCVQVGDVLDRGDHEIRILYFLERLQAEAAAAGGQLHVLHGNHETMTVMGQQRYSTPGAEVEAQRWTRWQAFAGRMRQQCGCSATQDGGPAPPQPSPGGMPAGFPSGVTSSSPARGLAMGPGGGVTRRFFADHPTVLQVGSSLFVHGGVLPAHVDYGLAKMNQDTRAWMLGESGASTPSYLQGATAVVWARDYSTVDKSKCDCATLEAVLKRVPGAERMIMGHTINPGINSACGDRALRIDVGMSRGCGDHAVEVLEILHDRQVRRLREGLPAEELGAHAERRAAAAAAGTQEVPAAGRERLAGAA